MNQKKTRLLLLVFVALALLTHAQPNWRVGTRIGANTFSELNLQVERSISPRLGLELYLGYNYPNELLDRSAFCSAHTLARYLEKTGPILKLGLVRHNKRWESSHTFSFEYRKSRIDGFIADDACDVPLGSLSYERYDWRVDDFGFSWYWDIALGNHGFSTAYWGLGLVARKRAVQLLTYGDYYMKVEVPDPRWNTRWIPGYYFDLGFKINFINIRK